MNLLIGTKPAIAKPTASLEENVSGFKFQLPKTNVAPEAKTAPLIETTVAVAPKPTKPNVNQLLPTKEQKSERDISASLLPQTATAIPALSDDKYEVVAGSVPEFSEVAGNKFQQQLEMLQSAIDGDGVLKDQLVNTLTFLDDNPEFKDMISPRDVSIFVAGCRKIANITVTEKVTRKSKVTKTTADVQDVMDDLADLSFEL